MTGLNPSPQINNDGWSEVVGMVGEAGICAALLPVNFTHFKVLWLVTSYLNKVVESILASCVLCALGSRDEPWKDPGVAVQEQRRLKLEHSDLHLSTETQGWGRSGAGVWQEPSSLLAGNARILSAPH